MINWLVVGLIKRKLKWLIGKGLEKERKVRKLVKKNVRRWELNPGPLGCTPPPSTN